MKIEIEGSIYEMGNLPQVGFGAQGNVLRHNGRAIKIFDPIDEETIQKIRGCIEKRIYEPVKDISTAPLSLVYNTGHRAIGYTMRYLNCFTPLSEIADLGYCQRNQISLKRVAALFYLLHESLEKILSYGFRVGDLRGNNIQFKPPINSSWQIAFMDVDSWAVRQGGLDFPCTAIHPSIMHPELRAKSEYSALKARHDWYAFAVTFASCLLKCNPFEEGYHPDFPNDEQRRMNGITCWNPGVTLTNIERANDFRFGSQIIDVLKNWLSGDEAGIFPRNEILAFYNTLEASKYPNMV